MDLAISKHNNTLVESFLNTIFFKWPGVTPLLLLTWFSDHILLLIVPKDIEGWVKLAITVGIGSIALFYTLRKKQQAERHDEEKHRQELAQDKMDGWISQYKKSLDAGIIRPETTLAEFIKQLETIEAANLANKNS